MKIIDYKVLYGVIIPDLENWVKEEIVEGWQPFGACFYVSNLYLQPMVKYESDELPVLGEIS